MIVQTRGIVLHSTKYSDTSLVVKIYTEAAGTLSFIIKGVFSKKSKIRASLFSPLSIVNITFDDHKEGLKYLKEISREDYTSDVLYDPAKSAILMFYGELLSKLLFEAGQDTILFDFLQNEILRIYDEGTNLAELPLSFLIRLSVVLGHFPENNYSDSSCYFSLEECRFQPYHIDPRTEIPKEESLYLYQLMNGEAPASISRDIRNNLLHYLIEYYKIHNEQIKKIESVEILSSILH